MAIDTNVQTFTDAELLALTRKAIADILAYGQSTGANGRTLNRADLPTLLQTQTVLEERVNAAAPDAAGGVALVQYGERA